MEKTKNILREIFEWVVCFIIAYILYLIINYFLGTVSGVKQVSMKPTAVEGDKVLIGRSVIFKHKLNYGNIITFEAPIDKDYIEDSLNVDINYPNNLIADYVDYKGFNKFLYEFMDIGKVSYIKRVIGMPGDHIVIGDDGYVYRNSQKLEENYTRDGKTTKNGPYTDVIVPNGCIFVMGDNRLESKDSRSFGCIPESKIDGYVVARVWPFNKFGKLK